MDPQSQKDPQSYKKPLGSTGGWSGQEKDCSFDTEQTSLLTDAPPWYGWAVQWTSGGGVKVGRFSPVLAR